MRRLFGLGLVGLMGVAAAGCPIYARDNSQCYDSTDCASGEYCNAYGYCDVYGSYYGTGGVAGYAGYTPAHPEAGTTGGTRDAGVSDAPTTEAAPAEAGPDAAVGDAAGATLCGNPNDCAAAETCGVDGMCHAGACDAIPCVNQFVCAKGTQGLACVAASSGGCSKDSQCAGSYKCVDGVCTAPAELCSDQTQCPAGDVCANGKCVIPCDTDAPCQAGYQCRLALHTCDVAKTPCAKTSDCGSAGLACVDGACVPACHASGACGAADYGVCVWNGCAPAQGVVRQCDIDGQTSGCGAGQICLHHHCYVSCETPNETACAALTQFTACKTVTTSSGQHAVCGSADNLGSECDPTRVVPCSDVAKVCIDGFCK